MRDRTDQDGHVRVTPPAKTQRRRGARATSGDIVTQDWGCVAYEDALARQLALHTRRVAGEVPDTLVLVSHPATFTLGRQAPEADIVLDRIELERRGIAVARSDRGGRATYHGPGQVVLYPIVSVADLGLGTKDWVCLLESALIDTLADYGVHGHRRPATAGIWTTDRSDASVQPGTAPEAATPDRRAVADPALTNSEAGSKIASLGLRVSRGVSYHGVALNTGLDASVFDCIVTCGVRGESVTTIAQATGIRPDDAEVGTRLARHVERRILEARGPGAASCETPA
ncbi:MAG: lipoyl(octanoyl) transferase LipB [Candidatus Binatia bacterium]